MYKIFNIITGLVGIIFVILFLLGITLTLDKSRYISFLDILPVWIIMLAVIFMLCLDFFNSTKDKNKDE
jgi:membrane-bound ClpP family serine protease|tara:strand:- start:91 stop:297 length:207 start_codon:yes stop_codon:yes gene_type:complete